MTAELTPELCTERFLREMEDALDGRPSSLAMIKSWLKKPKRLPSAASAGAIDAGGTNLRIASVVFPGNGPARIRGCETSPLPGTRGEVSADAFFGAIAEKAAKLGQDRIGFCFSFPADITEDRDGRVRLFSKEVKVSGAEGLLVGEELGRHLEKLGRPGAEITVVNDTTALLMANPGADIGMVLGTGYNLCYAEKDGMIINTEAGRFTGCPAEPFDFGPLAEMMISGAYVQELAAGCPLGEDHVYDRAGRIVAGQIGAVALRTGKKSVTIATEGTAFYANEKLRSAIERYMESHVTGRLGIEWNFIDARNSVLRGAACAALSA